MAGYIMNLKDSESLKFCIRNGVYSTRLSSPSGRWRIHHEATFGDYSTMKEGDNIYFFSERKVYGVGELINIKQINDCKFNNYPKASKPKKLNYEDIENKVLLDVGDDSVNHRWVCLFKPSPSFFRNGVDMDEILTSNPSKFKMLRAFWKLSFLKIDDEENKALRDIILRKNEEYIISGDSSGSFEFSNDLHKKIKTKINNDYRLNNKDLVSSAATSDRLRHEMALEAGILSQLSSKERNTIEILGEWDYLSHQVVASPFKPIDYMDKMDIFGYKYIPGFDVISKYMVMELKKDKATKEDVNQLIKYVDWINSEYTFGNYSLIKAFLIAYEFTPDVIKYSKEVLRNYLESRRPPIEKKWDDIRLIKYRFDSKTSLIKF